MPERMDIPPVSVAEHIEPRMNRYYWKISRKYMGLGIFFMLALISYVICIMLFFGEYVTYENLRYLVRDWSAMAVPGDEDFTGVVYNSTEQTKFTYFRGGLSMCASDSYRYYDGSGIQLIDDPLGYGDPVAASSDQYLLLYDLGGESYSVYNQLTNIIKRKADGAIVAGDIADEGAMVLVTRSRETRFVAHVYNGAFASVMNIYKENYVTDAAISPDGERIVLCSAIPAETDFNTEVEVCRVGSSDKVFRAVYEHTMPLDLVAGEEGFILLCDKGLYFFDYEGNSLAAVPFDGMSLTYASLNEGGVALAGKVNALGTENRVVAYDSVGNVLFDQVVKDRLTGVYASRHTSKTLLYMTTPHSVIRVHADGTTSEHTPSSGEIRSVIPLSDGAIVCQKSGAYKWPE